MDGVDSKLIDKFGGGSSSKSSSSSTKSTIDEKQLLPQQYKPSKKLKPFHWAKISQHESENTVFKNIEKEINGLCKEINFIEIDELFNKDLDIKQASTQKKKKREHQLIDPKRVRI